MSHAPPRLPAIFGMAYPPFYLAGHEQEADFCLQPRGRTRSTRERGLQTVFAKPLVSSPLSQNWFAVR
jgi:hypothetical protein